MFEDCSKMNRKRFRWRRLDQRISDYKQLMLQYLLSIILLLYCESTKVSALDLTFNISENLPAGTEVGTIDGGHSDFFIFDQTEGVLEAFDQNLIQSSGRIETIVSLDREAIQQYTMSLFLDSDTYQITVNVLDDNDNSPTFSEETITIEVSELSNVGQEYNINSAVDLDAPPFDVQGYRLVNLNDYFGVNTTLLQDGKTRRAQLVVLQRLDRETLPYHTVIIEAYDGGNPTPNTGRITVNVSITDSNDNAPDFTESTYNANVSEKATPGSDVITIKATDLDAGVNGDVTYSIDRKKSDPDQLFRINADTGVIYLNKGLDSESATEHRLTVIAMDGGAQPRSRSTVVIVRVLDVNDNRPTIDMIFLGSDEGGVSEGAAIGDYIARVAVSDADVGSVGNFNVTMTGGGGKFGLRTENNIVYLVRVEDELDREETSSYSITLTATDMGDPPLSTTASFTIEVEDINDNPPRFDKEVFEVPISEESYPGTFVIHLSAVDLDLGMNSQFEYSLLSSDQSDWFNLGPQSGLITTATYLDHETNPAPRLTVIATDFGNPRLSSSTTVVVNIGNANDTAPRFESSSYHKIVSEDIGVTECFLQVKASDPDFPDLTDQIAYSFAEGSDQQTDISLNPVNGKLCAAKALDREKRQIYLFRVKATDKSGQFTFAQVTVGVSDVNDNRPGFHPVTYVANVAAATSVAGNPVTRVTATDADDASEGGSGYGVIDYEFLAGNGLKLFYLDVKTGEIFVGKTLAAYGNTVVELRIRATDGGKMSSDQDATVTISILNDTVASIGGPVFTRKEYSFSVSEDAPVGKKIEALIATASGNSEVTYYIRNDPPISSWFSVDGASGNLTVASLLDREIFPTVELQVMATAGSPPVYGFATVVISLVDVNDNPPVIDFRPLDTDDDIPDGNMDFVKIPYNMPLRTKIYTFEASDPDEGRNAMIRFSLLEDAGHFTVDAISGILSVKTQLPHQNRNYSVIVQASDLGTPRKSTSEAVLIQVLHPDGSCPNFAQDTYSISVSEDTQLGNSFSTIAASSVSSVTYRLVRSVDSYSFGVFPGGLLYLSSSLDREFQDHYQLELIAEGVPTIAFSTPCIAMTTIDVTVNDVNDNVPYFDPGATRFTIKENEPEGSFVGAVLATDNDIGENADLRYSLVNENPHFNINSTTGLITTAQASDREANSSHLLLVQAKDISDSPLMSQVSVRVFVEDVNDNEPIFLYNLSPVLAVVKENQPSGLFVAELQAIDGDIGENSAIRYSISSGPDGVFQIDSTNGRVTTVERLNAGSSYSLTILAEDGGATTLSSEIQLEVKVVAESENPAKFSEDSYAFFVDGEAEPGALLGRFDTKISSTRIARNVESSSVTLKNFYISQGNGNDDFYVDRKSGKLFIARGLNFERNPQYRLVVTAENSDNPEDTSSFEVQVNVEDANDYSPEFTAASYSIAVQENVQKNTKIWKFVAVDRDIGVNGEVSFSIVNQTSSSGHLTSSTKPFRINPSTGALYTNINTIDREAIPEYLLVVKATDGSTTDPRSTTVSAVITVRDMNDIRPKFVSRDSLQILEDEPVGFPVLHLVAEDGDLGANSHVSYTISQQWNNNDNHEDAFQLNHTTGLITLMKKLNFEVTSTYYLNVSATDSAALDPLSAYQLLVIKVVDVNDEAPKFPQSTYFVEIEENDDPGTLVSRITATDGDSGVNGEVTYELFDMTESFRIDEKTGVLLSAKRLDREDKDSYTLTVYAHDGAFPSLYTWCTVEVEVLDANDNSPKFATGTDTRYTSTGTPILASIEFPEHKPGPALVYTVFVTDADTGENGKIIYNIADGNAGDSFTIDSATGKLSTSRRLDREQTSSYRLKLVVTDNGPKARSSEAVLDIAVLDWNDNDPVFTKPSYNGKISEGLPAGQFVLTARADDPDEGLNGGVTYSIYPDTREGSTNRPEGLFAIDPQTGVITTTAVLDREKKSSHQFSVQAVDSAPYGPRKTSVTVNIDILDVNDNHPIFAENLIIKNVSGSIGVGSVIASVSAQDKDTGDNGTVFYRISGGQTEPHGTGTWENKFQIDSTGRVSTTATLNGVHTYYLNVTASDNGSPPNTAEAVVVVNVVPFSIPNFSNVQFQKPKYSVELSEGAEKNARVTQVRADLYENGLLVENDVSINILYHFASGNEDETFAINHEGIISVTDSSELDYETLPIIRLIVSATAIPGNGDGPMYAYATVSISLTDENDNEPKFAQDRYITEVWEAQDPGIYVLQVSASDIDSMDNGNGEVRYYIDSGNKDQSFKIDDITGFVSTDLTLDREIHQEYKLIIYAYDLGTPRRSGSCTLKVTVVDIDDHPPSLNVPAPGSLSVSENADIGTIITKISAYDPDLEAPTFRFADDDDDDSSQNDYFTIDSQDGSITLAKSLDYEKMKKIVMKVQAIDKVHEVEKEIVLYIVDNNDNPPVFDKQSYQATLDELSPVNTSVTEVHAEDADSNANGDVTYSLIDTIPNKPAFFVDKYTGTVYTNMSEAFNPQSSIYNLIIMAEDHGTPPLNCTVSVRIQIADINNHAPVFSSHDYAASVTEAANRNAHVINVTATDADFSKENRHIYYEITSGNDGDAFKINTFTGLDGENTVGEICVANDLDRENISSYSLTVTAFDHGTPVKSSNTIVTVVIDDVNDNQPMFNQTSYSANISEDAKKEPVVTVFASDPDSSSSLMFKIIAGNDNGAFGLGECDPSSAGCALISANNLDYEKKSAYYLTVQVWDGRDTATSKSSVVTVTIEVWDVNEHPPYFSQLLGFKRVSELVGANQRVFYLPGEDADGGKYGELYYTVLDGNSTGRSCLPANEMFYVVNETGALTSRHPFDYERCQKYFFRVRVENTAVGVPQPSMTLPIEIEVISEDEFPPVFTSGSDKPIKLSVPYSANAGYVVGQVNATDADAGSDGEITYEIDDGQEFVIDDSTGVITLSRKLESSNNRVLTVTATSGDKSALTLVSIVIEGTPAIAFEAQILAIVFGVIAGIAVVIVLILCVKHRRNKKAKRPNVEGTTRLPASVSEFHDAASPLSNTNGIPVATPRHTNGKLNSKKVPSEHQIRHTGHSIQDNGVARHSVPANGHIHSTDNGIRSKSNSGGKNIITSNGRGPNGHVDKHVVRNSLSSGRGSGLDDDTYLDKEVDRINSSPDAANNVTQTPPKPRIRKKISGQGRHKNQFPDSGIQKDIDCGSDISDGPNNIKSPSVESIHVFGDEGAGEEPLSIQDIEEDLEKEIQNGLKKSNILSGMAKMPYAEEPTDMKPELASQFKSPLGTDSNVSNKGSATSKREGESVGADSGYSRRSRLQNWAPEFQPLADVFSEIAKLKDRENAVRAGNHHNTFIMKDLNVPRSVGASDNTGPPPLITSVAEQRSDLVAPVPLGFTARRVPARRNAGANLTALYPNSNPQYIRSGNNLPPTSYLPSLYSNAMIRPTNMPRPNASYNSCPTRPQVAFNLPQVNFGHGASSVNSSQQGLSVSSLPRTPISHESSFTSPAMSPNLTPSLSPLATRSPSVSTVGESANQHAGYDSDDTRPDGLPVSRSDPNLTSYRKERMVHV